MAKAAGQSVPEIEPLTREEYFLNQIAENGGGVSVYELEADFDNNTITAKVSAGELFDAAQHGNVILHGFITMSDTVYQESAVSIISSAFNVSGANKVYSFSILNDDAIIALTANSSDAFPVATLGD